MADTGIFATTAEILRKAGDGANTTASAEAYTNDFISQAESTINVMTRYNWSDAYSGLNTDVKKILSETASNLAAIYIINYDMGGYTSRTEAEDMINVLRDIALRNISILRDLKQQDFMNGA